MSAPRFRKRFVIGMVLTIFLCFFTLAPGIAATGAPELTRVAGFMMGEQLLDITYHLGYAPDALAVGCSSELGKRFESHSVVAGCPGKLFRNGGEKFKAFYREHHIRHLIVQKGMKFCSSGPKNKSLQDLVGTDGQISITYIDFSEGTVQAVREIAAFLGCPEKGKIMGEQYESELQTVMQTIKKPVPAKKVVILKGIYIPASGKTFLMAEGREGASGEDLLPQLGLENVADQMAPKGARHRHGYFPLRNLEKLTLTRPDAIIATGDAFVVQKKISQWIKTSPAAAGKVPAVQNGAVFSLPAAYEGGVLNHPQVLKKWAVSLTDP